jgi:polyisoprenoid-binding protein YceI
MFRSTRTVILGTVFAFNLAGSALAKEACPAGLPPQVTCGTSDMSAITAGSYKLDAGHAAVLARVSHIGYSRSVFRLDVAAGQLTWDPADLSKAKLTATVQTASITSNVPGFAAELAGDKYLNAKAFPEATFVSTAFRRKDATHGQVDGQFTLLGKTKPVTFDVALVGAGKGFGRPRLGVSVTGTINPQDYGMSPFFVVPIDLVIDVEFEKQP